MSTNQGLSALIAAGLLSLTAEVARAGLSVSASPTPLAPPWDHPSVLAHHATDDQGGNTSLRFMANRKVDENTMLIMKHVSGAMSHVTTGFGYFEHERLPSRERKLYTVDVMGTKGVMHLQGWDWSSAGVDLAYQGESVLETHCTDKWEYEWVGGAAYVADCMLKGTPSLITPEHGLHVLDVMNACHESELTGRRVKCKTIFPWPIVKGA